MPSLLPTPEPADPVEGQPGHFEHSNWLKASVKALDAGVVHKAAFCPIGTIVAFAGTAPLPDNWKICDGTNGTPDLRGKFILGASDAQPANSGGGAATVTLTAAQMPSHSHGANTGAMSGNQNHTHNVQAGGAHQHTYIASSPTNDSYGLTVSAYHAGAVNVGGNASNTYGVDGSHSHGLDNANVDHTHGITAEGGGQAHENMPPYWALVYIMRVA